MTQVLSVSRLESLNVQLSEEERESRCEKILKFHSAIAQVIAQGDAVKAKEVTSIHLDDMRQDFEVSD